MVDFPGLIILPPKFWRFHPFLSLFLLLVFRAGKLRRMLIVSSPSIHPSREAAITDRNPTLIRMRWDQTENQREKQREKRFFFFPTDAQRAIDRDWRENSRPFRPINQVRVSEIRQIVSSLSQICSDDFISSGKRGIFRQISHAISFRITKFFGVLFTRSNRRRCPPNERFGLHLSKLRLEDKGDTKTHYIVNSVQVSGLTSIRKKERKRERHRWNFQIWIAKWPRELRRSFGV